ncbi:MAG: hypothetical protein RIQ93_3181 [Verrucomicrobiota bacterium]
MENAPRLSKPLKQTGRQTGAEIRPARVALTFWIGTPFQGFTGQHETHSPRRPGGAGGGPLRQVTLGEVVRAEGIEPSHQAWEARILPLNYARGT